MTKISPSILSADFLKLGEAVEFSKSADFIHCDVMDGHFVPNITFGPAVLSGLEGNLDIHLMVQSPSIFVDYFLHLKPKIITFHIETEPHADRLISKIQNAGIMAGVSLTPSTHENTIEYLIDTVDLILVMTVNPGFGNQKFLYSHVKKIESIANMIAKSGRNIILQVDGGVNKETARIVCNAGANCLVAGSYIFEKGYTKPSVEQRISELRSV